ncbi:receptor-like protein EIX1 [Senna tora]|uniref:Receptor-like protein EIX1 n=1 Tax=Senna tora TaxID=362788 RepID=A0A834WH51_9FABA|nr:receptor-like protein EIX1 [Senna tora]
MHPNSQKLFQPIFFVLSLHVVCLVLLSCRRHTNASISCMEKERMALVELKQGFLDQYGRLSSWDKYGDKDCCKWWGIQCNNQTGHIEKLDLKADLDDQPLRGSQRQHGPTCLTHLRNKSFAS